MRGNRPLAVVVFGFVVLVLVWWVFACFGSLVFFSPSSCRVSFPFNELRPHGVRTCGKKTDSTRSNSNTLTLLASWHCGFEALTADDLRGDDGFEFDGQEVAGFEALATSRCMQFEVLKVNDHLKESPMCLEIEENMTETLGKFDYARDPMPVMALVSWFPWTRT